MEVDYSRSATNQGIKLLKLHESTSNRLHHRRAQLSCRIIAQKRAFRCATKTAEICKAFRGWNVNTRFAVIDVPKQLQCDECSLNVNHVGKMLSKYWFNCNLFDRSGIVTTRQSSLSCGLDWKFMLIPDGMRNHKAFLYWVEISQVEWKSSLEWFIKVKGWVSDMNEFDSSETSWESSTDFASAYHLDRYRN